MKATRLLETQHRKVQAMLEELDAGGAHAQALLERLAGDLVAHMLIEQDIFYPAVRDCDAELVDESFEEHAIAELALRRLLRTSPSDPTFAAKAATLRELVENHIEEEEEELFPQVEGVLGDARLEALGRQLEAAFAEARREGIHGIVPRAGLSTSADEAREIGAMAASARRA